VKPLIPLKGVRLSGLWGNPADVVRINTLIIHVTSTMSGAIRFVEPYADGSPEYEEVFTMVQAGKPLAGDYCCRESIVLLDLC